MDKQLIEIYYKVRDFTGQMKKENISVFAAGAAFFLFLSLVPMLLVICSVIPYTPLTKESLIKIVTELTPARIDALAVRIVEDVYVRSAGILSVAIIMTLWSAGKGVLAVMRGLNAVNGVKEVRNYFVVRMVASFYTLILLIAVLVSMIIVIFGNRLTQMLLFYIPQLEMLFSFLMDLRFLFVWGFLTILFSAFYAYLPGEKLAFRGQLSGASFAAAAWSIFSWGFSIYVNSGKAFNTYGSLGIIVIFLLWLYFCFYIMFVGAYLNKHFSAEL